MTLTYIVSLVDSENLDFSFNPVVNIIMKDLTYFNLAYIWTIYKKTNLKWLTINQRFYPGHKNI